MALRRRITTAAMLTGSLAFLAAVVAGMLVLIERRTPPPVSDEIAAYVSQMPEAKIEVWKPAGKLGVVGDSFSLDKPGYWHQRTASCLDYTDEVSAIGGSGFAQAGKNKQPFDFPERVEAIVAAKPDILIFATAFNDAAYTQWQPEVVEARALETIATYKAGLPEAKIVIMGPFWAIDPLPKKITDNRDILAKVAKETGATYVDSSRWVREDKDLADNDGQHPTASGHKLIANKILAAIRDAGLATPVDGCKIG